VKNDITLRCIKKKVIGSFDRDVILTAIIDKDILLNKISFSECFNNWVTQFIDNKLVKRRRWGYIILS